MQFQSTHSGFSVKTPLSTHKKFRRASAVLAGKEAKKGWGELGAATTERLSLRSKIWDLGGPLASSQGGMNRPKRLRILALHSFRTSAKIFAEQMRRAGLDEKIKDLVDIVYVNAPHEASGPIPDDVAPFFEGPYYEWWNAKQDADTQRWQYFGWETTLAFITDFIRLHGPFDGLMAFSQGTVLASLLISMQRHGIILQQVPQLKFGIFFAGVLAKPSMVHFLCEPLEVPSIHIIGDRDPIKSWSYQLVEVFKNPIIVTHGKGHVIPNLQGANLEVLRAFLQSMQAESSL